MRKLRAVNFDDTDDVLFIAECFVRCKDALPDDVVDSIEWQVCSIERNAKNKRTLPYLAIVDDKRAGFIQCIETSTGIGELHAVLLPQYRKANNAYYFLRLLVNYLIEELGFYKLKAPVSVTNAKAERLLRFMGFKKEGMLDGEFVKDGKRSNLLLLKLLKTDL